MRNPAPTTRRSMQARSGPGPQYPMTSISTGGPLGSNLGERSGILTAAVADLLDPPEVRLLAISPIVQTKAVGGPPDQPDFLNMVIAGETSLPATELPGP